MKCCDLKKKIEKAYPYRIELHAHTFPASTCSEISPEDLVDIYTSRGYDAVVIANHFTPKLLECADKETAINEFMADYERALRAAEGKAFDVILGAELRFSDNSNDYLLYGADRNILSVCYDYLSKDVVSFRREVILENSVFIQAHPFRNNMQEIDLNLLDGMETFNLHPNHNSRIGIAARYADENNIPVKIAGSDFHHPNQEAVSALRCAVCPKNSFELADIIKSGDYVFEIGETSIVIP